MTPDEAVEKVKDWMQSYEVTAEQELAELRRAMGALLDELFEELSGDSADAGDYYDGICHAANQMSLVLDRKPGAQ